MNKTGILPGILAFMLIIFLMTILPVYSPVHAASEINLSKGQTIYIPVYSHIYGGDKERPFDLAATLSIRNTDPNYPITIIAVDYYDSKGKLLRKYMQGPLRLNALSTIRYVVLESDKAGGSGANFIVKWKSEHIVNVPIIESVMIGTSAQQGISFTSRGQVIEEKT